ncbi:MAG: hypothetical protein PWP57_844 [Candidatus Atribacteria bacterium]|nr:hypothetical protein [Candidatus Atribacteria bacterium]
MSLKSVRDWILKAESDLKVAKDELASEEPATDAICFHSEQCAEKYLKAYLIFYRQEIPRTHNVAELIYRCPEVNVQFKILLNTDIPLLTSYAVVMRYPGEELFPPIKEAQEAVKLAEKVKTFVMELLAKEGFEL